MKTLKGSILNRSSHGGEGFKSQRREMIKKWLREYDIKNYTINDDFTIDVDEDVKLHKKDLTELPAYIQFGTVTKSFYCSTNNLTSLRGCPRVVGSNFDCGDNILTSLKDAPEKVGRDFDCSYNQLSSLEGAPKEVGESFLCLFNKLTSLVGAPKEVKESFDCSNNRLTSLKGAPEKVRELFECCHNKLTSLEGAPKEVTGFVCSNNTTTFTEEDVRRVCDIKGEIFV